MTAGAPLLALGGASAAWRRRRRRHCPPLPPQEEFGAEEERGAGAGAGEEEGRGARGLLEGFHALAGGRRGFNEEQEKEEEETSSKWSGSHCSATPCSSGPCGMQFPRPSWQLWRRLPSPGAFLPKLGTTTLAESLPTRPFSPSPSCLAVTCSVSASPKVYRKIGIPGDDFKYFLRALCLAVT